MQRLKTLSPSAWLIAVLASAMSLYHIWVILTGTPEAVIFRGMHLLFALALTFLIFRSSADDSSAPSWRDYAWMVVASTPILYLFFNYDYLVNRIYYVDDLSTLDMVLGVVLIVAVIEATRRVIGWALPITAMVFLVYALFISRVEPMRLLDQLYMTTEGIFGIPLSVSASYVMIFVLFGAFVERTGTGRLFMDFAMSIAGGSSGGPGKVAVISSSLFGTISGSAVANVMVTGTMTIPLMKRTGFRPAFAGGVEAVASTGGQIMPPIMGAAAFVLAEFLGVSYAQVTIWALIPAILFYVACFGAVHFEARRLGLAGLPRADLPRMRHVLAEHGHLFLPVVVILAIIYAGYSAPLAALAGTVACFPVAALRKSSRGAVTFANLIGALIDGAKGTLAVALACACAGIVIGAISLTGVGIVFTQIVISAADQTLLLALILTMFAGILLGMGMPTTPAYIIMTALLVPALVKLGVVAPAAHMFAFYFAIMSAITPPVALAVYAAAGLAKSDLWETGWASVKIGAAGFIVPFMFVYEPALLMIGDWQTIITSAVSATCGALFLAAGLHGFFLARATRIERAMMLAAAFTLIKPGLITDLIGFGLALGVIALQWPRRERAPTPVSATRGIEEPQNTPG
ncbi:MAG: C4-dicarboxylate ABC transporter permease [Hyphomicrobiales bacterium]|nr:MAG: C4-dicarboxylate ABC transporter permease [Hyphomicrobiales bacterium]